MIHLTRGVSFKDEMVVQLLKKTKRQTRRTKGLERLRKADFLHMEEDDNGRWVARFVTSKGKEIAVRSPFGGRGATLWVKEAFRVAAWRENDEPRLAFDYRASPEVTTSPWIVPPFDAAERMIEQSREDVFKALHEKENTRVQVIDGGVRWERGHSPCRWRAGMYMPRYASRLELEVIGVRVERLHDISEADARAEGAAARIAPGGDLAGAFDHDETPISYRAHFADLWRRINGPRSWAPNPWVWRVEFRLSECDECHGAGYYFIKRDGGEAVQHTCICRGLVTNA